MMGITWAMRSRTNGMLDRGMTIPVMVRKSPRVREKRFSQSCTKTAKFPRNSTNIRTDVTMRNTARTKGPQFVAE